MDITWIVTADAGRARVFSQTSPSGPLQEIEDMVNSAARLRTGEKYTDRLGEPTSGGKSIHNTGGALPNKQYEPPQTPDEREAESFAKDVCAYLAHAARAGRYDMLILSAEPKFLGVLRMWMDSELKAKVSLEINKDYAHASAHELRDLIEAYRAKHED